MRNNGFALLRVAGVEAVVESGDDMLLEGVWGWMPARSGNETRMDIGIGWTSGTYARRSYS